MSVASNINLPKLRLSPKKVISPQIYDFLRKHITETNIKPGTLLSENSLSEHFHVSRQPVREALMRLSYEGLLSVLPQRGSVVERISVGDLVQTVFVRTAIEKECALNITKLDAKTKRNCLAAIEKVIDQQRRIKHDEDLRSNYFRLDDLFHEKICALSGAPMAWNTIQSIKGQMDRIRFLTFDSVSPTEVITHEHEQIFEYLKAGDLDHCLEFLSYHLSQIIITHKSIIKKYSDWFTPESLSQITVDDDKEKRAKSVKIDKSEIDETASAVNQDEKDEKNEKNEKNEPSTTELADE